MGHYKSNVRDLQFNLFDVIGLGPLLDAGHWGEMDSETVQSMLAEVANLAEGPLAESFASSDRNPPIFDPVTHSVHLPEDFRKSFRILQESGWFDLAIEPEIGGVAAPKAVQWAIAELILGAQPAAFMYASGTTSASIFYRQGTEEQKNWARICVERGWGSTMESPA